MDHLRPNALVTVEAKKDATRAARYREGRCEKGKEIAIEFAVLVSG